MRFFVIIFHVELPSRSLPFTTFLLAFFCEGIEIDRVSMFFEFHLSKSLSFLTFFSVLKILEKKFYKA